ncbi:hypothetical protein [uncultured Marixanthomonas sp.]|uniref:hypothetical protein n=1 Tax=uncultured Marixanthomonas sp. TaxID=757245 RepID=UPI0030DA720E|tara:strand:+ start:38769 stop:39266 length:498 start_codon:yes stop_codon:yes gene_type:complete
MALDNLISISFTEAELEQINQNIAQIKQVLEGKVVNLTPEECQQYGSVADRNKILVNKCKDYMEQAPETLPGTVEKTEFDADYVARKQLESPFHELNRIAEKLNDTKILLDHDNFHNAIAYRGKTTRPGNVPGPPMPRRGNVKGHLLEFLTRNIEYRKQKTNINY